MTRAGGTRGSVYARCARGRSMNQPGRESRSSVEQSFRVRTLNRELVITVIARLMRVRSGNDKSKSKPLQRRHTRS